MKGMVLATRAAISYLVFLQHSTNYKVHAHTCMNVCLRESALNGFHITVTK